MLQLVIQLCYYGISHSILLRLMSNKFILNPHQSHYKILKLVVNFQAATEGVSNKKVILVLTPSLPITMISK